MRPKTHFEQIPVDTVMKIAKRLPESDLADAENNLVNEPPDRVSSPAEEGWRAVAQQIQLERDPKTMSVLVQKLIAELDQQELRRNGVTRSGQIS